MATSYAARCRDCGHDYFFTAGPLMSGTRHTCQACGDTILIRRCAPKGAPEMSREALLQYVASERIELDGRDFTPSEQKALQAISGTCYCGGMRRRDEELSEAVIRGKKPVPDIHCCPVCKSTRIDLQEEAYLD